MKPPLGAAENAVRKNTVRENTVRENTGRSADTGRADTVRQQASWLHMLTVVIVSSSVFYVTGRVHSQIRSCLCQEDTVGRNAFVYVSVMQDQRKELHKSSTYKQLCMCSGEDPRDVPHDDVENMDKKEKKIM